jgi:O-methyltransferase involved in polyketide biosynthesis
MNEVNKTLFIPLYGKAKVSQKQIILHDPAAERIWAAEGFPIRGKSRSKWLCYNMAMRARVFDDWTEAMLAQNKDAAVLHIGCGLDSRCQRVKAAYRNWVDCDFPDVIALRKKYYAESERYHMLPLDASDPQTVAVLPEAPAAIAVLEGLSMYLTNGQLLGFFNALQAKYPQLHVLMDIYTEFGAKASKYKNPINDVGVTRVYGINDMEALLKGTSIRVKVEHSFTPEALIGELKPMERAFFRLLFTGKMYRSIYRLYELEALEG